MARTTLHVRGMRCAGCVNHVERNLKAVPGVTEALVNLATEEATVTHDPAQAPVPKLVEAVKQAGYEAQAEPDEQDEQAGPAEAREPPGHVHEHDGSAEQAQWSWRLLIGALLAAPVILLGMMWMAPESAWLQFILATPVQVMLGWPFYGGAFKAARHGRADMDTLVALGTSVAYIYSAVGTILGGHGVYFDTAVVILVLIGMGKYLESRARSSAAAAIRGLMDLQPHKATLIRGIAEVVVPVEQVRPHDILLVRPGQRVPVDGRILEGRSAIDQSMVTGESMPVEVGPGDAVIGGTVNQSGAFRFEATRTGKGMLLAQVVELVKRAQASKASIQRLADAVAGVFVPMVLLIALGTLLGWGLFSSGEDRWVHAMVNTVAVLIVACPCALGLATPTAIMVGTGLGAREGILIKDAAALERAGRLTHVILDKTGTLTEGQPTVTDVIPAPGLDAHQLLGLAASVEQLSEHPLGRAIVEEAYESGVALEPVEEFQSVTGGGVRARVGGQTVAVERPQESTTRKLPGLRELRDAGRTAVMVLVDGEPAGLIGLADEPKPNAAEVVAELHALGLKVMMMTGDNEQTAQAVARRLGIDDVLAEALPTNKHDKVNELRASGAVVAMVGDGINDAPALAAADIGIAMGGASAVAGHGHKAGTDIAMEAGHVVLVGGNLAALPRAIRLSRATMRRIHTGLFWAFAYNLVLLPIAAAGYLHPMLAAAAMALSSVSVVLNALWLRYSWER